MKLRGLIQFYILSALFLFVSGMFVSCNAVYDEEGDCTPKHKIRFVYDMNLKWADAFPSEVNSVNLYVFDEEGIFLKEYLGRGEQLANPGYMIDLDELQTGKKYTFVAWCGLYNEGASEESFSVTEPVVGSTSLDDFICRMNTLSNPPVSKASGEDSPTEYSDSRLYFLYHGMLQDELLQNNNDGATYIHTIYLTKDTNHIRILLQEIDNEGIENPDDFNISLTNADGEMAYNNALIGNTVIEYLPWAKFTDMLGVGSIEAGEENIIQKPGLVADLSVGRMMEYQKNDMMLLITNNENGIVARVPVIQYFTMQRPYYEEAYNHKMSDQEFLDRQDEYVMTFFLKGGKWIYATIEILQWRIVIHNYDLE